MVSVIVPVYNVEKYIKRCIESILVQTYTDFELLLIDDGTTDMSSQYCKEYASKDPRIKYVYKNNGGLSDARNTGLDLASGDYICFVDGDDYIESDLLEIAIQQIQNSDSDMCVFGWYIEYNGQKKVGNYRLSDSRINANDAQKILLSPEGFQSFAWNKIYKAELWEDIRYPIGKYYEDIYTTYKIIDKCERIKLINKPLYIYIQRKGSISNHMSYSKAKDYYEGCCMRGKYIEQRYPEVRPYIIFNYANILLGICFSFLPSNRLEFEEYRKWSKKLRHLYVFFLKQKNIKLIVKYHIWFIKNFFIITKLYN